MTKTNYASFIVAAIFFSAVLTHAQTPVLVCGADSGVDFRIVTDKLVYAPKSKDAREVPGYKYERCT